MKQMSPAAGSLARGPGRRRPAVQAARPANPAQAVRRQAPLDTRLDAQLFRALGEPTRLRLFAALAKCCRPCMVGELAECTAVDLSVVSRHLALLESAGLLEANKQGRRVFYTVRYAEVGAALRALAEALDSCARGDACCAPGTDCAPAAAGLSRAGTARGPAALRIASCESDPSYTSSKTTKPRKTTKSRN